jgi:anthranilate/para-aminobenzoate synthase component I
VREKRGNCVPVYVELPADLITPCMAYLRIAKDSKYSFLLESVIAGENIARYSFIGAGELCIQGYEAVSLYLRSLKGYQDWS